jgi:hypothetical protein
MRVLLALALVAAGSAFADVPKPAVRIENPDSQCVAPPAEMRRQHMEMLKHQRDLTLRQGVRGGKVSLNGCIECHAGKQTGSVTGADNFCQSCHAYAAVKLDCWDCHQAKAGRVTQLRATGVKP